MSRHRRLLKHAAAHGDIAGAVAQDELLPSVLFSAGNNPVLTGLIQGILWVRDAVGHGLSRWSYLADLVAAVETRDGDSAFHILEHDGPPLDFTARTGIQKKRAAHMDDRVGGTPWQDSIGTVDVGS